MGKRRTGREQVLKFLYQSEFQKGDLDQQIRQFAERVDCHEEAKTFMEDLIKKIFDRKNEIDDLLKKYSEHWTLDRMNLIDRNILRLAVCELLYFTGVPPKVVINEALEISKKYGSVESPDFINGILDKIYKENLKEADSDLAKPSLG